MCKVKVGRPAASSPCAFSICQSMATDHVIKLNLNFNGLKVKASKLSTDNGESGPITMEASPGIHYEVTG